MNEQAGVSLDGGQRRPQLMRGVRDEPALRVERGSHRAIGVLKRLEHAVEAGRQQRDLVATPAGREPAAEITRRGDLIGGAGHDSQRAQGTTGNQP